MARANKYTSINFNHVYDKNVTGNSNNTSNSNNNPSKQHLPSASYSTVSSPTAYKTHLSSSSSRSHGRMLVLTRPTSKPVPSVTTTPPLSPSPPITPTQLPDIQDQPRSEPELDSISLRPSGRTGSVSGEFSPVQVFEKEKDVAAGKFVPPHLRPGFAGKEDRPGPEVFRGKEGDQRRQQHQQQEKGYFGSGLGPGSSSPGGYGEDGRPKSGGGYERMRRGGESEIGFLNRPRSSGNRPSSSGR